MDLIKNITTVITCLSTCLAFLPSGNANAQTTATINSPGTVDWYQGQYWLTVDNVPATVSTVKFSTWTTANGQDDIEWIPGQNLGNGRWTAQVYLNRHREELGEYLTNVYSYDNYGNATLLCGTSANVTLGQTRSVVADSPIGLVDQRYGTYDVYAYNIDPGVTKVRFPTWSVSVGQTNTEWVDGTYIGSGTWKGTVDLNHHLNETGLFMTDVYKYDAAGNGTKIGHAEINVPLPGKIPLLAASSTIRSSNQTFDIFLYKNDSSISSVKFQTWTEANGQDDLEWIEGKNLGNGVWKATVSLGKHNLESGTYLTNVYQYTGSGTSTSLGSIRTQVVTTSQKVDYAYDANGRIDHLVLPGGQVLHFIYDANGNLLRKQ